MQKNCRKIFYSKSAKNMTKMKYLKAKQNAVCAYNVSTQVGRQEGWVTKEDSKSLTKIKGKLIIWKIFYMSSKITISGSN